MTKDRARKKPRRSLKLWELLTLWLLMSVGFTAYQWFLVVQDDSIAPREKVVLGSIYKWTTWKQNTAFYSFTYAGRRYRGSEIVAPDLLRIGDVAVYFDPEHPSTNTLIEYSHKRKKDREVMHGCGYASIGLLVALSCISGFKKAKAVSTPRDLSTNS